MRTAKGIGMAVVSAMAILLAIFGVFVLGTADYSVSAAGGGGDPVAEAIFTVKVEPIKLAVSVVEGRAYDMSPGDIVVAEAKITNSSPATDWAITVDVLVGPTIDEFYDGPLVDMSTKWKNSAIGYTPGDVISLKAGETKILSISLEALDAAGQTSIKVKVRRLWAGEIDPSLDNALFRSESDIRTDTGILR